MNVLITGGTGRCARALTEHLGGNYEFTYLDVVEPPAGPEYAQAETIVADIADYEAIRPAFDDQDAVVHLAAFTQVASSWRDVLEPNIIGTYNVLEAARDAEVESVVFASTNHVVGMYEKDLAPELYTEENDFVLDHTAPVRPDSHYAVSKSFGEDLGRYYIENYDYPRRFYALRICSLREDPYDHPYGDAERGVEDGRWERDSSEYRRSVARLKASWHSQRDFAHEVDCCLEDDSVEFDIFSGVSDNRRRWFDLEHARAVIGYDPQDDGSEWDGPPT